MTERVAAIEAHIERLSKLHRILAEERRKQRAVNEAWANWIDGFPHKDAGLAEVREAIREAIK